MEIVRGGPEHVELAVAIDDDASMLFLRAGLRVALAEDHWFVLAEEERWEQAAERGDLWLARRDREILGFAVLGRKDGALYLDQVSVWRRFHRQGVGGALVEHGKDLARTEGVGLLLTTYGHLPWNGPYYRDRGFRALALDEIGPELAATLEAERAALPMPEQRVAMRWDPVDTGVGGSPGDVGRPALS